MAIDWQVMYDANYSTATHGVSATLVPTEGTDAVDVTAIDKTTGVEVGDGVDLLTILPAADIRMAELVSQSIGRGALDGGTLEMNGKVWRIRKHELRPSPAGESEGEIRLFLADETTA